MGAVALALHATGCELITEVDRSQIPGDAGCADGQVACGPTADCPGLGTTCLTTVCNGCCSTANAAAGTACSDNGGKVCNGAGKCAGCLAPTDCPAQTTVCKVNACDANAHTCGTTNVAKGTACSDSNGVVCDGLGACVAAHCADGLKDSDETDVDCGGAQCVGQGKTCAAGLGCAAASDCTSAAPCNGNDYTAPSTCNGSNLCVAGSPVDCAATAKVCNAIGCVACNGANDCPATGNECIARTCNANACGTSFLGSSHVMSTGQTSGNCQSLVCNGSGGTTSIDDNTDPPPASVTVCASAPLCTGNPLAPTYTPAATGTSCSADGQWPKHVCGDTSNLAVAGKCVQCNVSSDCLAVNDAGSLTCVGSVCQ